MVFRCLLLLLPLLFNSCGYKKWWGHTESERRFASSSLQQLLKEDEQSFNLLLLEKLTSLHYYTMIGHKNLRDFDKTLEYESIPYLNLMALRTQMDEIEHGIREEYYDYIGSKDEKRISAIKSNLFKFASYSRLHAVSLENLMEILELSDFIPSTASDYSDREIDAHYTTLQQLPDFQVHEKNIDHLSHMIDLKVESETGKFVPSINKPGNVSGAEFPHKVWSLTFDDGPGPKSLAILTALKKVKLKATFFQLMHKAREHKEISQVLKNAEMEIGAHSWSHQDLTKVGNLTLDKEVNESISELGKLHKQSIGLYRLPYGAGMNSAHIRERIASSEAIHVFWTVDTLDWMPQAPQDISDRTLKLMQKSSKDSGIILFHDTHERTVLSLPSVMDYLKKGGRKVCTVGKVLQDMNQGESIVCP